MCVCELHSDIYHTIYVILNLKLLDWHFEMRLKNVKDPFNSYIHLGENILLKIRTFNPNFYFIL